MEREKQQSRLEREGKPSGIDKLFAPEHLVATSNDEITFHDVIRNKIAKGQIPTVGLTKKKSKSTYSTISRSQSSIVSNISDEFDIDKKLTIKSLVGKEGKQVLRKREEMWKRRYNKNSRADAKEPRNIVETYRKSLTKSKSLVKRRDSDKGIGRVQNHVEWKGGRKNRKKRRKREIEEDILGKSGRQFYTQLEQEHDNVKSKVSRSPVVRSMSYIALEQEVEALRKTLFKKGTK